ncbi:PucR family transcriptional regulator [Streptomyces griseoluteus]|uniref:PucR family transcriptional regulator n=1 Tax=Streptomyces griseoluteus TaxID=29306 RepID=UPI0036FBA445
MESRQALGIAVGDRIWQCREDFIADLLQMTRSHITDLDHDAASRSLLGASITENVVAAINFIRQGIDADLLEAPTAALAYARFLAQRDVPQSALIRAYRIGHARFLDHAFPLLDDLPADERTPLVLELVRLSGQFIDQICEQVGRTYEREREQWVASQSGVRQQWVSALLGEGPLDRAAAEKTLRYPLDGLHVACTLWPADRMTSFDLVTAVDEIRTRAVAALRARASLVVPTDEHEARLWLALPDSAGGRLAQLAAPAGCQLHAAVGEPGAGLAGFRSSARQAAQVREVLAMHLDAAERGDADARRPLWVRYAQVAPVALMARDVAAVRDFVRASLGRLATTSARGSLLRETLRSFLTHHRSHSATAQAMNLHRNSIQYRVQQATALLPNGARSLDDDFDVRTALLAAYWLGGAVLD